MLISNFDSALPKFWLSNVRTCKPEYIIQLEEEYMSVECLLSALLLVTAHLLVAPFVPLASIAVQNQFSLRRRIEKKTIIKLIYDRRKCHSLLSIA